MCCVGRPQCGLAPRPTGYLMWLCAKCRPSHVGLCRTVVDPGGGGGGRTGPWPLPLHVHAYIFKCSDNRMLIAAAEMAYVSIHVHVCNDIHGSEPSTK